MTLRRMARLGVVSYRRACAATEICVLCAQSVSPDWPFALLWPFLRLALASAVFRLALSNPLQRSRFLAKGTTCPALKGNLLHAEATSNQCLCTPQKSNLARPASVASES